VSATEDLLNVSQEVEMSDEESAAIGSYLAVDGTIGQQADETMDESYDDAPAFDSFLFIATLPSRDAIQHCLPSTSPLLPAKSQAAPPVLYI